MTVVPCRPNPGRAGCYCHRDSVTNCRVRSASFAAKLLDPSGSMDGSTGSTAGVCAATCRPAETQSLHIAHRDGRHFLGELN